MHGDDVQSRPARCPLTAPHPPSGRDPSTPVVARRTRGTPNIGRFRTTRVGGGSRNRGSVLKAHPLSQEGTEHSAGGRVGLANNRLFRSPTSPSHPYPPQQPTKGCASRTEPRFRDPIPPLWPVLHSHNPLHNALCAPEPSLIAFTARPTPNTNATRPSHPLPSHPTPPHPFRLPFLPRSPPHRTQRPRSFRCPPRDHLHARSPNPIPNAFDLAARLPPHPKRLLEPWDTTQFP